MRYFVHDTSNRKVSVDINPANQLGKGATAVIYKVEFESEVVAAKVYHANKKVDEPKIRAMLSNKPDDIHISFAGVRYPQIAWPFATLRDEHGVTAGYLMPLVNLHDSFSLDYFYDQVLFKKLNAPDEVAFSYKLEIAKNLSLIVAALHKNKHYFIDLKPQNIRVFRQTHIVSLVDCDGFSVADKKSNESSRFPAELISTDYISPEAFRGKVSPKALGENQDRYALAVILFQLLNNGTHPFQGILVDDEGVATNDEKAAAGLYPHSVQPNLSIKPRPQSIHFLWDDKTRQLFDRAFIGKLDQRPSAEEWANHFERLLVEKSLVRCDKEPLNIAHMRFKGKECPACYLDNLKVIKPKQDKISLTKQKNINRRPVDQSFSGSEMFWLILGFIVFISILVVVFNKQNNNSVNSKTNNTAAPVAYQSDAIKQYKALPRESWAFINSGWSKMDPESLVPHNYKGAYDDNLKAYLLGSPEGASNLGLLFENGWGVAKDLKLAFQWYTTAMTMQPAHSAQAELGLARIYLTNPTSINIDKAQELVEKAKVVALDTLEIWPATNGFLAEAEEVESKILRIKKLNFKQFVSYNGLIWSPSKERMNWSAANQYCLTAVIDGKMNWRLPHPFEVFSLIQSRSLQAQSFYKDASSEWNIASIWTSQIAANDSHKMVWLDNGVSYSNADNNLNYVSCVSDAEKGSKANPNKIKSSDSKSTSTGKNAKLDPKALAWAERNPWFYKNKEMQAYALSLHEKLLGEGVSAGTDLYYSKIDEAVRLKYPVVFQLYEADKAKN